MSSSFFPVGVTQPCRVRAPLMKYLNRAMMVTVTATLVHHIKTKVVEVKLMPVINRLQSKIH